MQKRLYCFEKKSHRQAWGLHLLTFSHWLYTHTHARTHRVMIKGDTVQAELWSILYQPPPGTMCTFKSTCVEFDSGPTAHACVLCVRNWHVLAPFEKYTSEKHREFPWVCTSSLFEEGGGHLAACGTLSTCVLFPCGTQAQVRDASFTLMCHQSVKLETSQSATYPSTPPHTLTHAHTLTHIWTVL